MPEVGLFVVAAAFSTMAFASSPDCPWVGESRDPFTKRDERYLQGQMLLRSGLGTVAAMTVHHAIDGQVQFDISFDENGTSSRKIDAHLQFLLEDGTVVGIHFVEPEPPTSDVSLGLNVWFVATTYTRHRASGVLPLEDVLRMGATTRITQVRHDLLGSGSVTRTLSKGQSDRLVHAMKCVADG